MKAWVALTFTGLMSFGSLATAGVLKPVPASDRIVIDTLTCVRSIVEEQIGGRDGMRISATYIDRLEKGENPSAECLATSKNVKPISISYEQQVEFVRKDETLSGRARYVLGSFVRPKASCHKVGFSAGLAISLLGVNAKLDGAKCFATNGRSWLQVTPGIGWSGSPLFAVYGGVNKGVLEREITPMGIPVDFSISIRKAMGLIVAAELEERRTQDRSRAFGFGLGAAPIFGVTGEMNIGLIPLGTADSILLDLMK